MDGLRTLELGVRQSGAGRGAKRGFLIGAGLGGGIMLMSCIGSSGEVSAGACAGHTVLVALTWGGLGAGLGALIGAGSGSETWVPIPMDGIRVSPVATLDGFGVSLSVPVR